LDGAFSKNKIMREIKKGDKYLCKTDFWSFLYKNNIYEIKDFNEIGVFLINEMDILQFISIDSLVSHFTDLQEVNEIKVNYEVVNKEYDYVNPSHYQNYSKEVIEMMFNIWGKEKLIAHCEMCAFKYRMRVGEKPNQPIDQDLKKAKWYEEKAKELKNN